MNISCHILLSGQVSYSEMDLWMWRLYIPEWLWWSLWVIGTQSLSPLFRHTASSPSNPSPLWNQPHISSHTVILASKVTVVVSLCIQQNWDNGHRCLFSKSAAKMGACIHRVVLQFACKTLRAGFVCNINKYLACRSLRSASIIVNFVVGSYEYSNTLSNALLSPRSAGLHSLEIEGCGLWSYTQLNYSKSSIGAYFCGCGYL